MRCRSPFGDDDAWVETVFATFELVNPGKLWPDSIRRLDSESNQSSQKGSENEVKVVFTACSECQ
jgi:hypothetical protein